MQILTLITQLLFIPLVSPLVIGCIRKIKAHMQNRRGASVTQPYWDLIKLFRKDEVISSNASWIFRYSPYLIFSLTIIIALGIPILAIHNFFPYLSDFLVVIYLVGLTTFFLAISGIDTGSAFGGFGSSREMTLTALTEGAFVFSLLSASQLTHSGNLFTIAQNLQLFSPLEHFPLILAFIAFLAVLLAETKRFPFDNPATHLELTMIHEAMILEYSGKRLALIEWASYNKLLIFIVLGTNIFFPWNLAVLLTPLSVAIAFVLLIGKIACVAVIIALIESVIAKYRFFRLPDILITAYIFAVISLVAVTI